MPTEPQHPDAGEDDEDWRQYDRDLKNYEEWMESQNLSDSEPFGGSPYTPGNPQPPGTPPGPSPVPPRPPGGPSSPVPDPAGVVHPPGMVRPSPLTDEYNPMASLPDSGYVQGTGPNRGRLIPSWTGGDPEGLYMPGDTEADFKAKMDEAMRAKGMEANPFGGYSPPIQPRGGLTGR